MNVQSVVEAKKKYVFTGAQSRAGRALLNWTQPDLAAKSGLSLSTIQNFELQQNPVSDETQLLMRRVLERAGVTFIDVGSGGGVGLAESAKKSLITVAQSRAGRALLNWSQSDLAKKTGLSLATIRNFELQWFPGTEKTRLLVRAALERAGVEFINTGKKDRRVEVHLNSPG